MKLSDIVPGMTLLVSGTGYKDRVRTRFIVTRVTKTQIKARLANSANTSEFTFSVRDGAMLPRDKYVPDYIAYAAGTKVESFWSR